MTIRRRVLIAVTSGIASLVLLAAPPNSNKVNGVVEGQAPGQNAVPLPKIEIVVDCDGNEKASTQTGPAGAFSFSLDTSNPVFRMRVWDGGNRWWGREISHLPNDPAHANLSTIVLRPQTSKPSPADTPEQRGIISWLRKHSPLSAGLMELHLGTFDTPGQPARTTFAGVGASVFYPEHTASAAAYQREHPDVAIDYQTTGSGAGIRAINAGAIDFGTNGRRITASGRGILRIPLDQAPVGLTATVVIYNSRKLPPNLHLSGPVLAKIFLGQIESWNAPDLKKINPNSELPAIPITVATRSDANSSTDILSRYLAEESPAWKERFGIGPAINWPVGKSAAQDAGVTSLVSEIEGAIGYVDFGSVNRPSLRTALLQNLYGSFVAPTATSIASGYREIRQLAALPDTSAGSKDPQAYPMASVEWMILALPENNPKKDLFLLDFARFSLTSHGGDARQSGLAPLPPALLAAAEQELNRAAAQILDRADARRRIPQ